MADDVVIINQGYELRTTAGGKERVVIIVHARPLIHTFDAKRLGKGPAHAIAEHFRRRISELSEAAAPATIKARQVAARAFAANKPWALARYAGGRIGPMAPAQSDRIGTDSGRMAKSITANASGDAWRVNVAANRLSPGLIGIQAVQAIFAKLVSLIPELADPRELLTVLQVRKAIADSKRLLIARGEETTHRLTAELGKVIFENIVSVFETLNSIAA